MKIECERSISQNNVIIDRNKKQDMWICKYRSDYQKMSVHGQLRNGHRVLWSQLQL